MLNLTLTQSASHVVYLQLLLLFLWIIEGSFFLVTCSGFELDDQIFEPEI